MKAERTSVDQRPSDAATFHETRCVNNAGVMSALTCAVCAI